MPRSRYKNPFRQERGFLILSILSPMFTTYVLFSKKYGKIYIGYSSDVKDRLISHNERATKGYTIKFRLDNCSPWTTNECKKENQLQT